MLRAQANLEPITKVGHIEPMTHSARPLDHLVLPVPTLDLARARLAALGFTVAPQGTHPFGTINACVFFADGTFLEPLAIGDPVTVVNAMHAGNAFVSGDAAFRVAHGGNGFSALVLGSSDADADDAAFREAGFGGGKRLDFERPFKTPAGEEAVAAFRLAFAMPGDNPSATFFTCERVNPPRVDRSALERHESGVTGIRSVLAAATGLDIQERFWAAFSGATVSPTPEGLSVSLPNARVDLVSPEAASAMTGLPPITLPGPGLRFAAITFAVGDPGRLVDRLTKQSIGFRQQDGRIIVDPAPGQGTSFIFEV